MGPETRTPGDSCARSDDNLIEPGHLQQLQQLAGEDHDPQACQFWRGVVGLCRACTCALQELLVHDAQRQRIPTAQAELLATLRGILGQQRRARPASGPQVANVAAERDAALAVVAQLARRLPPAELRAALDAAGAQQDVEHVRTGLTLAILAAERVAAGGGHV